MRWINTYRFLIIFPLLASNLALAQTATSTDILKTKIEERNNQIKQLEEEIKQYNIEVQNAGSQAKTLQSTIKTLDLTKNKISKDINLTETKISKTALTIDQLDSEIDRTKANINTNKMAIIAAIQSTQIIEDTSIIQLILSKKDISEIWGDIDDRRKF